MENDAYDPSISKTARIAGFLFLFTFIGPLFYGAFVFPKLTAAGNGTAAAGNILTNEFLFRMAVLNELICSVGAVAFALVLYIMLKPMSRNCAMLAVFLKMTEAILLAVIALGHYIALLILKDQSSMSVFEPNQIQALVGSFMNSYFYLGAFTMFFHGLNLMMFLYLLFKSKYLPAILPGFGIFAYALIFVYALMNLLAPDSASKLEMQVIFFTPSVFTELIIGSWLLWKGVNVKRQDIPAPLTG